MPLQPGPFILQPNTALPWQVGTFDFHDYTVDQLGSIDTTLGSWDPFILDAADLVADPLDPLGGVDIDGVLSDLAGMEGAWDFPSLGDLADSFNVADTQLTAAIAFAPAAAWQDPSAQFTPPDTSAIYAPTVPSTPAPVVNVPSSSGPTTVSTAYPGGVTLTNLSSPGSPNFTVGDQFRVNAQGNTGDAVTVHGTLNGQDAGTVTLGQIGADGTWSYSDTIGPDSAGSWVEDWAVGGVNVAVYMFIVAPGN